MGEGKREPGPCGYANGFVEIFQENLFGVLVYHRLISGTHTGATLILVSTWQSTLVPW